ncbi:MAG: replicative DNA helicase [Planctomycetota bacterium]|nr:replicative DNA helicase [Planctomycetota bacterium]
MSDAAAGSAGNHDASGNGASSRRRRDGGGKPRPTAPAAGSGARLPGRERPTSYESERAVIGSVLLKPDVCDDVTLVLSPADFDDDACRLIFERIREIHESARKVDVRILVEALRTAGELERVGGAAVIAEFLQAVPHAAHAVHYAEIVREKSLLRALIDTSTAILSDAYDSPVEARKQLGDAETKIFGISEQRAGTEARPINDVLKDVLHRMDARMKHDQPLGGVETGFTELDTLCGGLHNQELIILAARPSMGKTALAMNIAEHVAIHNRRPVLFVSLEMAALELTDRLLCSSARVNGHRLRNGTISQEDRRRLVQKASEISAAPLFIDDSPARTLAEIGAVARRIKRKHGLALVAIDYLQLIEPDNPRDPRQEQVARIARRLKTLARQLEAPLLCLAQLNRQAEVSRDNKPRLHHLRESGAIEQDADVVMFVHREEYYQTNDEDRERVKGQAEIIIAKQRNGPIGDVKLLWQHDFTRFVNQEHRPHSEFESFSP